MCLVGAHATDCRPTKGRDRWLSSPTRLFCSARTLIRVVTALASLSPPGDGCHASPSSTDRQE
ncbi:hypothetical protein BD309DRAFT_861192 [Dichomitus squalens]|nr:hypothetical protein BD309DRAFT_861192 [Dichomitus squalens]